MFSIFILHSELGDHDRNLDGGVFAESVKSLHGNNNFATTFYSGGSSDAHSVTGERKRYSSVLTCLVVI